MTASSMRANMRLVAEWVDPNPRSDRVGYRLSTDGTAYYVERAERDLHNGVRWEVVGSVSLPKYQVAKPDSYQVLAGLLGALAESAAEGTAVFTPPRSVTSG